MLWTVIAVSACVSLAVTPIAGRLALHYGFVDRPARHKFHDRTTPLLGGLALYLGTVPLLAAFGTDAAGAARWAFAAAVTLLFAVGMWDDWRRLGVGPKLAAQMLSAVILVASGVRAELPGPAWMATLLSLLWIVGITNAVNLLDSMDGAAAGVAAVASAGFLWLGGGPLSAVVAAALAGALLGFLPYNLPPARIFMGDAGSLLVGFSLAVLGLEAERAGADASVAWMVPVLLLAVPIFDTTLVSWSRLRRGKNPLTHPGKDHFAHRLVRRGLGLRGVLTRLYVLAVLSAVLAFVTSRSGPAAAWAVAAAAGIGACAGLVWLERREPDPDRFTPPVDGSPDAGAEPGRAPALHPPGRRGPRPCAGRHANGIRAR